jgi:uncharacterized protein
VRIGVISDTHGKLRSEVFKHFDGVEHILHAGDIGHWELIVELEAIAPVTAVYGNTDDMSVRARVPDIARVELAGRRITVLHGNQVGSPTPALLREFDPDADIIVYGHTHKPLIDREGNSLVLNPGGAGAPRFGLRPSIAIMTIDGPVPGIELIEM